MTDTTAIANHIHALLFTEGGTMTVKELAKACSVEEVEISYALTTLKAQLEQSGLTVIRTESEVSLVANKEESEFLRAYYRHELGEDIGEAGLEVLATVLYRDGATKPEIDYIRGVNTATTIRTLLSRGLLERRSTGARQFSYHATTETLAFLGVQGRDELPEYATIVSTLAHHVARSNAHDVFSTEQSNDGTE